MSQSTDPAIEKNGQIRERLLQAGLTEFAHLGLKGARLECVAAAAGCAKRMIYYYFGDKEGLYLAVLTDAYRRIRQSEADIDLDHLEPVVALHTLAHNSFDYHDQNPDFTRLVLVENLQNGVMMERLGREGDKLRIAALEPLGRILRRGAAQGLFHDNLDPAEVHYLISSFSCYRIDHSGTWKKLLKVDLLSDTARECHRKMMISMLNFLVGYKA